MGRTEKIRKGILTSLFFALLGIVGTGFQAEAVVINFDGQGLTGPSLFLSASPSPQHLDIGGVFFDGGVILTNTANLPANQTSVYGTASSATGTVNPLTITFPSSITNFYLDVLNGLPQNIDYTVADNLGHSATFNLISHLSGGQTTIGFATAGNIVTITAALPASSATWDFFIDNIQFNGDVPPNPVPEPGTMLHLGSGLIALAGFARRRFRK